jgi:recombination protein RecA
MDIKTVISEARKKYGDCIVDPSSRVKCDVISTGSLKIDIATGIGGIPRGRVTEIFGRESSGKSTLCLHGMANAQAAGGLCAYFDAEHALDSTYAKNLGVDLDKLIVAQPDNAEQTLDMAKDFLESGLFSAIFIDSVAGMVPKVVLEGGMEDQHMGVMARLLSKAMPKLYVPASKANTALVFVNQIRSTMGAGPYQPQETTPGGHALRFAASLRIKMAQSTKVKDSEMVTGNLTRVTIVKNKMAQPFREADPEIEFGSGFAQSKEVIDLGKDLGFVEKSGSWYSYGGERLGQGLATAAQMLDANPEILREITAKIKVAHGLA